MANRNSARRAPALSESSSAPTSPPRAKTKRSAAGAPPPPTAATTDPPPTSPPPRRGQGDHHSGAPLPAPRGPLLGRRPLGSEVAGAAGAVSEARSRRPASGPAAGHQERTGPAAVGAQIIAVRRALQLPGGFVDWNAPELSDAFNGPLEQSRDRRKIELARAGIFEVRRAADTLRLAMDAEYLGDRIDPAGEWPPLPLFGMGFRLALSGPVREALKALTVSDLRNPEVVARAAWAAVSGYSPAVASAKIDEAAAAPPAVDAAIGAVRLPEAHRRMLALLLLLSTERPSESWTGPALAEASRVRRADVAKLLDIGASADRRGKQATAHHSTDWSDRTCREVASKLEGRGLVDRLGGKGGWYMTRPQIEQARALLGVAER